MTVQNLEALVISVNEPQLERCLMSINDQTIPFTNIAHINGVVPVARAFNLGIRSITEEWVMAIGGDFILNANAVEIAINYMNNNLGDKVCGYFFGLQDTFLNHRMGYCAVYNTPALQTVCLVDGMWDDRRMMYRLRNNGWKYYKNDEIILGTHFDKPDRFQVFRRFYFHGVKFSDRRMPGNNVFVRTRMSELLEKTGDYLYSVGLRALEFGEVTRNLYPGSPNIDFDRKMYVEFNEKYGE